MTDTNNPGRDGDELQLLNNIEVEVTHVTVEVPKATGPRSSAPRSRSSGRICVSLTLSIVLSGLIYVVRHSSTSDSSYSDVSSYNFQDESNAIVFPGDESKVNPFFDADSKSDPFSVDDSKSNPFSDDETSGDTGGIFQLNNNYNYDPFLTLGCTTETCKIEREIKSFMDTSVRPCDNFYQYACGRFEKVPSESIFTWDQLDRLKVSTYMSLTDILDSGPPSDSSLQAERKAQGMYSSCLKDVQLDLHNQDWRSIKSLIKNATGVQTFLKSDGSSKNLDFEKTLRVLDNDFGFSSLFIWVVSPTLQNSSSNFLVVTPLGVEQFFYTDQGYTSENAAAKERYLNVMIRLGNKLNGRDTLQMRAIMKEVLELEVKIAKLAETFKDQSQIEQIQLGQLENLADFILWPDFFKPWVSDSGTNINVVGPQYFRELSVLIKETAETEKGRIILHNYLVWQTLKTVLQTYIGNQIKDSSLTDAAKKGIDTIAGKMICLTTTEMVFKLALTSLFIRGDYKTKVESKHQAQKMVEQIKQVNVGRLQTYISWMDKTTKEGAVKRAQEIKLLVGYPDIVLQQDQLSEHYRRIDIDPKDSLGNLIQALKFIRTTNAEKINRPVDPTEWTNSPLELNAFNILNKNTIEIPLALFQPPFFHPTFPESINYGHLGAIMGHELLHGLVPKNYEPENDNGGALKSLVKYEYSATTPRSLRVMADLNLKMEVDFNSTGWWSETTKKQFKNRSQCLVDQYSDLGISMDIPVNGRRTLTENIADIGGLKAAFEVYRKELSSKTILDPGSYKPLTTPGLNQLSADQVFFLSFAQNWCQSKSSMYALLESILAEDQKSDDVNENDDEHSDPKIRVLGSIFNMKEEFTNAWNCKTGDFMNPSKKCSIYS